MAADPTNVPSAAAAVGAATVPSLVDDPTYTADPLHAGERPNTVANVAAGDGADPLTPLEALAIEHVMADAPFYVEARIWNLRVRYRVLTKRELLLCEEGAREGATPAEQASLLPIHWLVRAIVDIDGHAPVAEAHEDTVGTDEEPGARLQWLMGRKGPFFQRLATNFLRVQQRYDALMGPDQLPNW